MSASLLARIAQLENEGITAAVVTVVKSTGSTPREPGARMIVRANGEIEGTIGGGRIEQEATAEAVRAIVDGRPRFLEYALTQELGMCCGGSVALFIEVIARAPRLIVFGAGHVGTALVRMAAQAGFVVHVADERDELLNATRLPEARELHPDLDDPALPFGPDTFVMVTTHDHALDQQLVEKSLRKPHRWLGLIGSRRKAELTRQRLAHKGFAEDLIAHVRSPVGLAIAAETPEEIAVSILAELIAERRGVAPRGASGELPVGPETKQVRTAEQRSASKGEAPASPKPERRGSVARGGERVAGVILAAGKSSRFGTQKALYQVSETETMLSRVARVFCEAGLSPIIIVASPRVIEHARKLPGVRAIEGDPEQTMIESLARALETLHDAPGAVIQPVDAPHTTPAMIAGVIGGERSRVLTYRGAWGHPVYLARKSFTSAKLAPSGGLRTVLGMEPAEEVAWPDGRVLADVDTIDDLKKPPLV